MTDIEKKTAIIWPSGKIVVGVDFYKKRRFEFHVFGVIEIEGSLPHS